MSALAKSYDKIYSQNESPFGTAPLGIVRKSLDYISGGRVMDFGAGDGRNGLFLASQGFDVEMIDISPVAIEKILEHAAAERLSVSARVADAREIKLGPVYDFLLAIFIMHHFSRDEALDFVEQMQAGTRLGGLNVVAAFTRDSDFYLRAENRHKFYLDECELRGLYSDWQVLEYYEKKGPAFSKRPDGTHPMINTGAHLIARKVRE